MAEAAHSGEAEPFDIPVTPSANPLNDDSIPPRTKSLDAPQSPPLLESQNKLRENIIRINTESATETAPELKSELRHSTHSAEKRKAEEFYIKALRSVKRSKTTCRCEKPPNGPSEAWLKELEHWVKTDDRKDGIILLTGAV